MTEKQNKASYNRKKGKGIFGWTKGFNLYNNGVFASFVSLGNHMKHVAKSLYENFFFGNKEVIEKDENGNDVVVRKARKGINGVLDERYRNRNKRLKEVKEQVTEQYGLNTKKEYNNFLKNTLKEVDGGVREVDEIPQNVSDEFKAVFESEEFLQYWNAQEYNEGSDDGFTYSNTMAIYEHMRELGDLGHILGQNADGLHVTARQAAWIVQQYESADGQFNYYKPLADIYQQAYEARYEEIERIANEVYGRAISRVKYYSPLQNPDDNDDLSLEFAYSFEDGTKNTSYGETSAMGQKSFIKERVGGDNAISLRYIEDLDSFVDAQEFFIAGAEFFKDWNEIMNNSDNGLRFTIANKFGKNVAKSIMDGIRACRGTTEGDLSNTMNKLVATIRNNMALANLAFSFSSTTQQVGIWFLGAGYYGYGGMLNATRQMKQMGIIGAAFGGGHAVATAALGGREVFGGGGRDAVLRRAVADGAGHGGEKW